MVSRNEKQKQIVFKGLFELNCRFYIKATTGFGKSRMCIMTITELLKTYKDLKVNIVVPTIDLFDQWKTLIVKNKLEKHCRLYIVNTYIKEERKCNLLIADECHLYVSETAQLFNKLLEVTKVIEIPELLVCYVSATLSKEHEEFLLRNNIKCAGEVTREEALQNGWCANYSSYVLMLNLNEEDELEHKLLNKKIKSGFSYFQGNDIFPLILKCVSDKEFRKQLAITKNVPEGQLFVICKQALDAIRRRKTILQDCDTKEKIILEIVSKFKYKGLIFGQSTEFSDRIANVINRQEGEICLSVHSKKKNKENKESLKKLIDNRYNINLISSAKKLTTGIDIPDLVLGVLASYTSKELTAVQIFGRMLRLDSRKEKALMITLCIKGSQEETWLNKNGIMKESTIVYSVDEILQLEQLSKIKIEME